jgi:hypothetical protein
VNFPGAIIIKSSFCFIQPKLFDFRYCWLVQTQEQLANETSSGVYDLPENRSVCGRARSRI